LLNKKWILLLPVTTYQYYLLEFFRKHPEQLPEEEMTADEIVNTLLERDKDLLTKLYEGTYEEEEEE
jgi:hypothetical protein